MCGVWLLGVKCFFISDLCCAQGLKLFLICRSILFLLWEVYFPDTK
jgi:hypothetical protein